MNEEDELQSMSINSVFKEVSCKEKERNGV